jgi:hypothetical protein
MIEITIETIPAIETTIDPIHVIAMTDTPKIEREDALKIATEIEMIAIVMKGLTDAGPAPMTIMMIETVNVEGSMMIENDLGLLTIGIIVTNRHMRNHDH